MYIMKKSITSLLSLKGETFVSCDITGIPLIISFPACAIDFSYISPFADIKNIKKVCSLQSQELHRMPKPILAGILLGLLSHLSLIERVEISATEANAFLQLVSTSSLVSAIKLFSAVQSNSSHSIIDFLPRLSLSSLREEVYCSTANDLILSYTKTCKEVINPTPSQSVTIISTLPSYVKKVEVHSLTSELRQEAKNLVSILAEDMLMTPKLLAVLKLVVQKENLVTLNDEMRKKLIVRLEAFETTESKRLIDILNHCDKNAHLSEKIKKNLLDEELSRASDTFPAAQHRKSLSQILAEKMNKTPEQDKTPEGSNAAKIDKNLVNANNISNEETETEEF
jgi:hypothetical protein